MKFKQTISSWLILVLIVTLCLPAGLTFQTDKAAAASVNLALGKTVAGKSSESSGNAPATTGGPASAAVDGDKSGAIKKYWQPSGTDRTDDQKVWIQIDLGKAESFNKVDLFFKSSTSLTGYKIEYSANKSSWSEAYSKTITPGSTTDQVAAFNEVTGRYVQVTFFLNNTTASNPNFQVDEIEIYSSGPPQPEVNVLQSVYFASPPARAYQSDETISMSTNEVLQLGLNGKMTDGTTADLSAAAINLTSSKSGVASIDPNGRVVALQAGVSQITGTAVLNGESQEARVWLDVYDPAILVVQTGLNHPTMKREIGQPALLGQGDSYPSVSVNVYKNVVVSGEVLLNSNQAVVQLPETVMLSGTAKQLQIPGVAQQPGLYEIRLKVKEEGKPLVYDSFYFTVLDPSVNRTGQSNIVFPDADGNLDYVPDYKGNRIIDFSNAGYKGGGVKLPDVQARVAIEPGEGDDTQRIQDAINQVSTMPLSADGFRGAVLLKKGKYEVAGTLAIKASGVVLRGEGQGEDGTIMYAAGNVKRTVLTVGGASGPLLLQETATPVTDLFVPTGSRSFHVENAGQFKVGDKIMVSRIGNDRWIHNIEMDQIVDRPGAGDATQQWPTFDLNFDRIITGIKDNVVTVDAPLANSIERRWGGALLMKYDDADRIEQVGIENMRIDSEFDRSKTAKVSGSVTSALNGQTYFSDDNHAWIFAALESVKNAWMRDVTSYHLGHSLVSVGRSAKWVTVQDSKVLDMVSVIVGGNRYGISVSGQLALVQRIYTETARHAFLVDSRVLGPNVFLDSEAQIEHSTSEPHHRWSVGGLYDNVKASMAIVDRGWLGSGHGWSGANYVAWNTEGLLSAQQPPTAQNYVIGHIGTKAKPFLPNKDDLRPRTDAFWDQFNQHVSTRSLYLKQLEERLGSAAVRNIQQSPVGGGLLDIPNDKPVAGNSELTTPQNTAVVGTLTASDAIGNPLTYSIVSNGTKGKAVVTDRVYGSATDQLTGTVTNYVYGSVTYTPNPGALGLDTFTFKANDGIEDSNISTVTVHIIDTIPPVITLNGASTVNLTIGETYTELGATATDNGGIAGAVTITGTVNTGVAGTYTLRYNVKDLAGNAAVEVTRTVIVTAAMRSKGSGHSQSTEGSASSSSVNTITVNVIKGGTESIKGLDIQFPPGVMNGSFKVTVEQVKDTTVMPVDANTKLVSEVFSITKDKDGDFNKLVTITLPFDKSTIDPGKVELAVFWLNENTNKWIKLDNIKVDLASVKVSGDVLHFTKFAVMATAKPGEASAKPGVSLTDLSDHWAEQSIQRLVSLGAISGYPDNSFQPNNRITRAEFVAILVKAFKLESSGGQPFADTKSHWASDAIAKAVTAGIVTGYSADRFGPDDPITREQMALMVMHAAGIQQGTGAVSFVDSSQISSWAQAAVAAVQEKEIIAGYNDGSFKPQNLATRAEAATVIVKSLK
ncbi:MULTISPECIES: S-layer homology domain-containing protein [unclassified Paenibacillus]|uniref:S-layer homology domain-containing protein n=1 Tax=unclassified Paenibacillus TaxID=185978 RepID=UPI003633F55F